ncbi:MAG: T9SS type A sorting domain-containing protein, partial [Bacteroidales bacterium]|nr:T9SS type A sorting domain-containing protein [Bacteroidales bacterium]
TLAAPTPVVSGTYTDCEGTKIYTYTYEDCAGLQYVWTYTYTIERADFMMPLDEGSTITCASQLAEPILPEVTDNCGNVLTGVLKAGYPTATPQCDGEVEYVYTFTDCAGNAHDWTYTYTIERNIVPELTGTWPDNITGQDNCFANANVNVLLSNEDAAALYSSNCGGNVTATHNDVNTLVSDCGWTITRTYTITDGCTETTNVQSVSGSDQTAPAITNTNLNRELISTNCTFIVPNLTEEVRNIASDNCTAQGDLVITQDITPGTEITNATTVTVTVTDLCGNSSTKSIQLTLPELLTASLSAEAILCNDGTVDIINTVEGGTADYTFVWNTDATSQNLTGVHAGTYSVTVTDANGCTAVPTITISEPTALTTSLSTEAVSCNGGNDGSITVSVSGGTPEAGDMYYYSNDGGTSWTDASVSPYVFAGLTAGNYDIAVKDKNGCIKNCGVMEVTQPDVFAAGSIAGADTTICCGLTPNTIRNLTLPNGGDGSYTYQWQYSTDGGSSWTDISSNTTAYVPEEVYVTTWFRRQVKDATCQTEFTESDNIYKVTVSTPSVTGISDGDFVWSGNADATNWSNAGNWLVYNATTSMYSAAGSQPTTSDNVYLVTYGDGCSVGNPTMTAASFANNLTIGAGKSISLGDYNLTLAESLNNEGTFNGNAGILSLAGDLNNAGTFNCQTGAVVFSGTSQTVSNSASLELYDVHFNQSSVGRIIAPNGITVNNQATFTQGVVLGDMIFVDGASASGANLASYVDGLVTKKGNGLFTFPTGSNGVLGTIEATVVNNTDEGIKARFNNASDDGHGYTTEAPDNYPRWWNINDMCGDDNENRFDHVSNFEYWKVEGISGDTKLTSPTLKVDATTAGAHFHDGSQQNAEAINAAAHYDCWKNMGGSANVENGGNTITISGMNDIKYTRSGAFDGIITLGSVAENVVLPIELLSFTATCDGKSALVEWTTATERNNDYFVLERSDDAINFTEVARVAGAGNSIAPIDYSYTDYGIHGGDNYYRLVQVDYDGTRAVSEVVVVNCIETAAGEPDVQAYPNPFDGELTLELDNFDNRPARIDVYDMLGKLIYTDKVASPQNYYETVLNLSNLPPATYTVRVSTADFVINKKVVKQ